MLLLFLEIASVCFLLLRTSCFICDSDVVTFQSGERIISMAASHHHCDLLGCSSVVHQIIINATFMYLL